MKGGSTFYCKFFIVKTTTPSSLADFDGYFVGKVKIVDCELNYLIGQTIKFQGRLSSCMMYWNFSSHFFMLSNNAHELHLEKRTPMHLIKMELREPFCYMDWLYYELTNQADRRGSIVFREKDISRWVTKRPMFKLDKEPENGNSWSTLRQLPIWDNLFGYKCDAVRLPIIQVLHRFYVHESVDPTSKSRPMHNKKLEKRLDKMNMFQLRNVLATLQNRPWELCLLVYAEKLKLPELSIYGFEAAVQAFNVDMKTKVVIHHAIHVYGNLKAIVNDSSSTRISRAYLHQQCGGNIVMPGPMFDGACGYLHQKGIMWLHETNDVALLRDFRYATTIFSSFKRILTNASSTPRLRGDYVPCKPEHPLNKVQMEAATHILNHRFTVVEGFPGSGKCLGGDTHVLLSNGGTKAAKNVIVGDRLVGDDGTVRIVTSVCSGESDMFRVYNSDKRLDRNLDGGFECNDVHNLVLEASFVTTLPRTPSQGKNRYSIFQFEETTHKGLIPYPLSFSWGKETTRQRKKSKRFKTQEEAQQHAYEYSLNERLDNEPKQCTMEAKQLFELFMSSEQRDIYENSGKSLDKLPMDKRTIVVGQKLKSIRRGVDNFPDSTKLQPIVDQCFVKTRAFPRKGSPFLSSGNMCYYVGVWLGDGKSTTPYSITIAPSLYPGEEQALFKIARSTGLSIIRYMAPSVSPDGKRIKEFVELNDKKRQDTPSGCFQYTLTTATLLDQRNCSDENVLCQFFKCIGLGEEKHIPDILLASSRQERLCLLAGLIDTDGYLDKNAGYEIIQKRKKLSLDIVKLSRSLGFQTSINQKMIDGTVYYRIHIYGHELSSIPCQIRKKIAMRWDSRQKSGTRYGTKIEYIGKGKYYGFQLAMVGNDGELVHSTAACDAHADGRYPGRFLLADYTVTHNTELITWMKSQYANILICSFVSMMVQALRKRTGPPHGREEGTYTLHYVITYARKNPEIAKVWLQQYDVVVIDEGSNVSLKLMAQFLSVLPRPQKFVILGDTFQIGPIQPGFAFADMIDFAKHYECYFRTKENMRSDDMSRQMADYARYIAEYDSTKTCEDDLMNKQLIFEPRVDRRPAVMVRKNPNSYINYNNEYQEGDATRERIRSSLLPIYEQIMMDSDARSNLLLHQVLVLQNKKADGRDMVNQACEQVLIQMGILKPPPDGGVLLRRRGPDSPPLMLFPGKKITFTKKYAAKWELVGETKNKNGKRAAAELVSDTVLNGEQGIVTNVYASTSSKRKRVIHLEFEQPVDKVQGKRKRVLIHAKDGIDPIHVDDGYACTTNKSQGSEWSYIIYWMIDNPAKHWTREYSYVAISRCKTACWVVGNRFDFVKMIKKKAPPRCTVLSTLFAKWKFNPEILKDKLTLMTEVADYSTLKIMSQTEKCSPSPNDPYKKYPREINTE